MSVAVDGRASLGVTLKRRPILCRFMRCCDREWQYRKILEDYVGVAEQVANGRFDPAELQSGIIERELQMLAQIITNDHLSDEALDFLRAKITAKRLMEAP